MNKKINAKTVSLIALLATLLCAVIAVFTCFFVTENNVTQTAENNTQTQISAPQINKPLSDTAKASSSKILLCSDSYVAVYYEVKQRTGILSYDNPVKLSGRDFVWDQSLQIELVIGAKDSITLTNIAVECSGGFNSNINTFMIAGQNYSRYFILNSEDFDIIKYNGYCSIAVVYGYFAEGNGKHFSTEGKIRVEREGKVNFDMSQTCWDYNHPFTYNGNMHTVVVQNLPKDLAVSSYVDNRKADAGSYTATVRWDYNTSVYNEPVFPELKWQILKANISPTLRYSTVTYGSNSAAPTVDGNIGNGAKTFSVAAGTGSATINSSTGVLTPTRAGTVMVTVSIAATTNYNAGSKSVTVTINKANISPTLSYSTVTYGSNSAAPTVGGNSGNGTKTFSVTAGTGSATINSGTGVLTPTRAGTVTVTVSIAATTNYNAASKSITVTIKKANQSTPTVSGNNTVSYKGTVSLTAGGGNGTGAYTWAVATLSGGGTATLSAATGGTVTLTATHVGAVRVTLYRAGDTNYNQSGNKTFDITITKVTPTVTATVANGTYYVGNALSTVTITASATHGSATVAGAIVWDAPTTLLRFDDGTVSYGWTWTPTDTANYNSVTGTAKVVALGMDDIRAEGQKTVYKAYESFTTDGMTVYAISAGNERVVTGYTVSVAYGGGRSHFLVSDSGCTVTITYTEGDKTKTYTFTVTVEKADYDMSGVTFDNLTVTYDGASHSIAYSGALPAGVSVTGYVESGVAFTGATNAGTYVISAVIVIDDADNRNLPALSATLKINKATAVIDVSGVQTIYTYNGSLQTVSGGATASSGQQVKYANNTFTTVAEGNGKVVEVYVEESTNYVAHSEYVTITVNKATAVIDVSGVQTVYTYNGSEQTVNSGATVNNTEQTVAYTNNKFTTVAEGNGLKVTVSVAESANYLAASATVTITVNKATLSNSVTFDDVTVTFNGKNHVIEATGFGGDVTVTYYYSGTTNAFTGETNVGSYEITAHFESTSDNYEVSSADAEKTATLTISARVVTDDEVTGIDGTYEYTGTAQTPAPVIEVQLSSDDTEKTTLGTGDYRVTYSTSDADAGTVVDVTIELLGNYSGTVIKTFTITPKQLGIKWSTDTSFIYNGSGQGMVAEFTGLVAGDVGNISPTIVYSGTSYPASSAMPEDAGNYTITVTLDAKYTNYVQFVGLTNHFTIKKATPTAAVKFDGYDPDTDKLYPDNKLPDIVADGDATANGLTVAGHVEWKLLDNGNAPYLLLNENSYAWVFIPDDIVNFEIYEGTLKLTAVQAELKTLSVEWKNGEPKIYVSWDLAKVREYILVTGTLENGDPYGEISNYVISGSWGMGDRPVSAGSYDLKIVYNGKNGSLIATYLAVEIDSIKVTVPTKTDYVAFEEFDKSTVTVTAVYNDGTENDVTDFDVAYRAGHRYLWAGDGYVTVRYTEGGITKDYQVGGLTVNAKTYDMGNISFGDVTVNYDGTLKTVTVTGTFAEGVVSYVYRQDGATIPGVSGVTNAGGYEVVATFTLVGEEYITNYYCDANGVIGSLTAKLIINKIDYVGVGSITFVDTETDYNYGASVVGAIQVKNLPAGVTVSYAYADKDNNPLDPTQVVNAGEYFVTVSFGVDANHNAIQPMTAKFTVNKLDPKVTPKVSGNLSKGAHLYQVICALSDGDTAGTIVWDNDETVLEEGVNRCYYTFVPDDSVNFNTVNSFIDVNASATGAAASGGLEGWEIALIVVCIAITFFTLIAALIVISKKKSVVDGDPDSDGFNDIVTEEELRYL